MNVEFPEIKPIPKEAQRPLWSVMIPVHNRCKYLEQTIKSVLDQDPGIEQMQIEVVDNFSKPGDLEKIVRKAGQDRVSFFRQPREAGMSSNWTTCIRRAKGRLVHILHDDDMVISGFYRQLQAAFKQEPAVGMAFCRSAHIDEDSFWQSLTPLRAREPGVISDWLARIAVESLAFAPTVAVRRKVYEDLGGFLPELVYAADWEMWKRIAVHYSVWYEPQILACYREHSFSGTGNSRRSALYLSDTRKAIEISQTYLPVGIAKELTRKSRECYAITGLETARRFFCQRDRAAMVAQIPQILKCSHSPRIVILVILFLVRASIGCFLLFMRKIALFFFRREKNKT